MGVRRDKAGLFGGCKSLKIKVKRRRLLVAKIVPVPPD
jgi:hypothetical protein